VIKLLSDKTNDFAGVSQINISILNLHITVLINMPFVVNFAHSLTKSSKKSLGLGFSFP